PLSPDARTHPPRGPPPRREHARQLAARDDVEARAQPRHQRQDREVGIRLDGVRHERLAIRERLRVRTVLALDRAARIDEAGRAEAPRDLLERYLFGAQRAVAVREVHDVLLLLGIALGVRGV